MLSRSRAFFNFFPLGRRGGEANAHERYGSRSNVIARTWRVPSQKLTRTDRHRLTLDCPLCAFKWDYDCLTVFCPAVKDHNKREAWITPDWFWKKDQPYQYYKSMRVTRHPRTGQMMADAFAKSKNNERRGQGLTSKVRNLHKQTTGISYEMSGIGSFSNHWLTHFPYPG